MCSKSKVFPLSYHVLALGFILMGFIWIGAPTALDLSVGSSRMLIILQ